MDFIFQNMYYIALQSSVSVIKMCCFCSDADAVLPPALMTAAELSKSSPLSISSLLEEKVNFISTHTMILMF